LRALEANSWRSQNDLWAALETALETVPETTARRSSRRPKGLGGGHGVARDGPEDAHKGPSRRPFSAALFDGPFSAAPSTEGLLGRTLKTALEAASSWPSLRRPLSDGLQTAPFDLFMHPF